MKFFLECSDVRVKAYRKRPFFKNVMSINKSGIILAMVDLFAYICKINQLKLCYDSR